VDEPLSGTVTVVVVNWNVGLVDRDLLKVGPAVAVDLSVDIREKTALEERVVGEVDTTYNMAGVHLPKMVSLLPE